MCKTDVEQCIYYGIYAQRSPWRTLCGRRDPHAEPDVKSFRAQATWDDESKQNILKRNILINSNIRKNQKRILILLYRNVEYYKDCGWKDKFHSTTVKLLESLRPYGLVGFKHYEPMGGVCVYELTPFGREYVETRFIREGV